MTARQLDLASQRLLHWLYRYPLQRGEDLVLALAPWVSRALVYRRLALLEQLHLVEWLRPVWSGNKRLYYLGPTAMQWCAAATEPGTLAREREHLERLLPRLPTWLLVQTCVNGLVQGAAEALTQQGKRAEVVRWNWQRDEHRTVPMQERVFHVRLDGVLALCLRFPPAEEAQWYTFVLLCCPLDAPQVLLHRLDRLLRWREAGRPRPGVPPVLLLATSLRQAECWQKAAAQVTARWHAEPLCGAVACVSAETQANSWRWNWKLLGTNRPCHLQDLAAPSASPAVLDAQEPPVGISTRAVLVGRRRYGLAERAAEAALRGSDLRLGSLSCSKRHWEILHLCLAHPLLSQENLCDVLGLHPSTIRGIVADLHRIDALWPVHTPLGRRWVVSEAGLHLLARTASCPVRLLTRVPLTPQEPLQQRGVRGLHRNLAHTAGLYGFFAELARAFSTEAQASLRFWETGGACEQRFTFEQATHFFKPDALACVQCGSRVLRFWVEWDRGTMGEAHFSVKWATYAAYLTSQEWRQERWLTPTLLVVAPEMGQERMLRKVARQELAGSVLQLFTTTLSLLLLRGPLDAIWRPLPLQGGLDESRLVRVFTTEAV